MFTFCCVFLLLLLVTLARADSGRDRCEEMFVCAMAELFFFFLFTYFCRRRFKRSTHAMTLTSPVVGFRNQKKTLCASFFRRRLFSPLPNRKKSKVSSCFIIGPICAPRLSSSGGIEKSSRKERRNERYRY